MTKSILKLSLYVAAGYGTYEILKRTGALEKAAQWLTDHVPEDVQAKIKDQVQQAKDQVTQQYGNVKDQAQQKYATLKDQAQGQYESLRGKAQDAYGQAKDQAQKLGGTAGERFDHAKQVVTSKFGGVNGGGQKPASDNAGMQPAVEEEGDSVHSTDASSNASERSEASNYTDTANVGQTITGPGRGVDDATSDVNGGSVHHRVGRGVVHG